MKAYVRSFWTPCLSFTLERRGSRFFCIYKFMGWNGARIFILVSTYRDPLVYHYLKKYPILFNFGHKFVFLDQCAKFLSKVKIVHINEKPSLIVNHTDFSFFFNLFLFLILSTNFGIGTSVRPREGMSWHPSKSKHAARVIKQIINTFS